MDLELSTPPAALVSSAEAKAHLRITHDREDALISALISTAMGLVDGRAGWLRRAVLTQSWKLRLKEFPWCTRIELPLPQLQSVTAITYYDENNALQTFSSANYAVNARDYPGYLQLAGTASWPATYNRIDAVIIEFVAGYAASAPELAQIKSAVLLIVSDLYYGRGDRLEAPQVGGPITRNDTVQALLYPLRANTWPA